MRKVVDCREAPSVSGCTLTVSGEEDEVLRAAVEHAVSVHGHEDSPGLHAGLRGMIADEGPAGRYGTVMVATLTGDLDGLLQATRDWADQRRVDGFLGEETLLGEDGRTVVQSVFFRDQAAYAALAADPEQERWWTERFAPHLSDVRWIDGTWGAALSRSVPSAPAAAG